MMNAFLVGSRVYGEPREDSDIDLVVRMSPEDAYQLRRLADPIRQNDPMGVVRYGKLNLVVCETDALFEAWVDGFDEVMHEFAKTQNPVTRARAIEIFYRANYAPPKQLPAPERKVQDDDDIPF